MGGGVGLDHGAGLCCVAGVGFESGLSRDIGVGRGGNSGGSGSFSGAGGLSGEIRYSGRDRGEWLPQHRDRLITRFINRFTHPRRQVEYAWVRMCFILRSRNVSIVVDVDDLGSVLVKDQFW